MSEAKTDWWALPASEACSRLPGDVVVKRISTHWSGLDDMNYGHHRSQTPHWPGWAKDMVKTMKLLATTTEQLKLAGFEWPEQPAAS